MKTKILKMIRSALDGEFVSGQEMCEQLGVSRTAVWKCINQLKDCGYEIEAVPNKGYHIISYPDRVDKLELESLFNGEFVGKEVHSFAIIDSTNNEAKRLAEAGAKHGTLVISEQQNGGKGRRGRNWASPAGNGIWMTLILRPELEPIKASMLTLVAAMAVRDAIIDVCDNAECQIKWPNDIVINGKKICGILTEMSADPDSINYVVVGIGINVNTESFPDDIAKVATSIRCEVKHSVRRSSIIVNFEKAFEKYYARFIKTQDLSLIKDEYNKVLVNIGRTVKIIEKNNEYTGKALGIDETGCLLVEREDGTVEEVLSGEVSVRGVYGYV